MTNDKILQSVTSVCREWEREFDTLLGKNPDLTAHANLVFNDDGIKGGPIYIGSNVYACLLLNFYGMNELGWECGVWDCLSCTQIPGLHADNPKREYNIAGVDLHFTVDCLDYLNRTFGTTCPEVPEYMHRNGPLFDNLLKYFRRDCHIALFGNPWAASDLTAEQQTMLDRITSEKVCSIMFSWVRSSGLTQY